MELPVPLFYWKLLENLTYSTNCNFKKFMYIMKMKISDFFQTHFFSIIFIRCFTKFGIKVAWSLQFLGYLRTLHLKFQKARTKTGVFLGLPFWLSQLNWDSQIQNFKKFSFLVGKVALDLFYSENCVKVLPGCIWFHMVYDLTLPKVHMLNFPCFCSETCSYPSGF